MATVEPGTQTAAELHWLATLLTGSHEIAAHVTVEASHPAETPPTFFSAWIEAWSRRIVIAKALAAMRQELARSARRTVLRRAGKCELPSRSWMLDPGAARAGLERAFLRIDVFPRAALLLLVFEHMALHDAATLLDAEPHFVRTAAAVGGRDLTINLAGMQGWKFANSVAREQLYV